MKTKLLLVHNVIAPYRLPLFNELSKLVDLTVCYIQKNDENRFWEQNDISSNYKIHYLNSYKVSILGKSFYDIRNHNLSLNKYDVIILPDDQTYFVIVYKLLQRINKIIQKPKVIFWTGNFSYYKPFNYKLINTITISFLSLIRKFMLYKHANFFWSYSVNSTSLLVDRFRISSEIIFTGLQGYPSNQIFFDYENINYESRFKSKSIVFLGYPSKRKNFEFFVNVLQRHKNINFKIFCVGPTPKNKIKGVNYLGYYEKNKKYDLLNKFTFAVLPSKSEPWGWVVNECMSIGLPILVSEAVMAKEMVSEKNLIFELNELSLSKSLDFIANISFDHYVKLSNECMKSSSRHTLNKTLKSFDKIMRSV